MKKLVSFLCCIVLMMGLLPVHAADVAVLAVYREGNLVYSAHASKNGEGYDFTISDEYENDDLKVYCAEEAECNIFYINETETETPAPTETASPLPEEETAEPPAQTATAAPVKTPYPAVYEKALDAVNAPAVVEKVSEQITDGETYYVTSMLYQGVEITSNIRDSVLIESAPAQHQELIGENAAALREGDVIHFTCDLQGRIKSIEFIYRPDFADYVKEGGSYGSKFAKLIGSDKYSTFCFGIPVKTAKGYMLLADITGKTTDIDLNTGTFVYTVRNSSRGDKAELTGTGFGAIEKVYVQSGNFDDDDNVISWQDADTSVYALARLRNGTATEVIVFVN
ncbi:MAG: hypothetical protein ACI4DP_06280 [Candidatus Ornithomonoglobus sp.]